MVVLTVEDVSKSYGDRLLFKDVGFGISDADRIGLIGANGAGKSTLLKIVLGRLEPDTGRVATGREAVIEYLSQDPQLEDGLGALDQVLKDGPEPFRIVQQYETLCRRITQHPEDAGLLKQMEHLSGEMERVKGWGIESEAKTVLAALGIHDVTQRVGEMSGGQKKRVALARALLRPSDLLILDEPTNHLDVQTVEWLEHYLANRRGALMLITHDRYFLDRVTNVIFELAEKTIFRHEGNYSYFLEAREQRRASQAQQEQKRAQLAKTELAWLRRGPQARTTKAKARIERANALLDARYGPEQTDAVSIETLNARLGKKILEIQDLSKSFDGRTVVRDFSYVFKRHERVGLVGPNGAGKSTLLNMITGRLKPDEGSIEVGDTVVFGYYDQQSLQLDETMRVHDYIVEQSNRIETADGTMSASQMLEQFLFSRKRQWDVIGKLSGGERRRLYLLKTLMEQPNVLLLDEPTNDLDVETLTVLEDYLDNFEGVVIAVSHDRFFLDRTVEHLLVFQEDNSIVEFPGGYTLWLEQQRAEEREAAAAQAAASAPKASASSPKRKNTSKKMSYKDQREYESILPRIAELEARQEEIAREMSEKHDDYEALQTLTAQSAQVSEELEQAMERWMELEEMAEQQG